MTVASRGSWYPRRPREGLALNTTFRLRPLVLSVVAAAALFQIFATRDTVLRLQGRLDAARAPFGQQPGSFVISWTNPEAEEAGIRAGDRLVAIDGEAVTGRAAGARATRHRRPGERLDVTFEPSGQADAATRSASIVLAAPEGRARGAAEWLPTLLLSVVMPWLCLLLGGWAAFARPGDRRAWLLLWMMLTFGQATSRAPGHWPGIGGMLGVAWQSFSQVTWPIAMLLFAIYFPERLRPEHRAWWAKWLLVGPVLAFALASALVSAVALDHLRLVAPLERFLGGLNSVVMALAMASIGLFFAALGYKSGTLESPDARRRARVLVVGAQVGLSPSLLLVGPALVKGVSPSDIAEPWVVAIIYSFLFIFPATLAYVVVVQRALDVRVAVRQGMQYALARGGVKVLRWLIMMGIVVGIALLARRPDARNVDIVGVLAAGGLLLAVTGRASEKLMSWTDRRFFREAYDAEKLLTELGDEVVTLVDAGEILGTVSRRIADAMHVPRVACLLAGPEGYAVVRHLGYDEAEGIARAALPPGSATVARLRHEGGPLRTYLEDPASWVNRKDGPGEPEKELLRRLQTQLLIPLMVKEKLPGLISLSSKRSEEAYSATDLRLLKSVATQVAMALENSRLAAEVATEMAHKERLNREVEIAREVQERLFPQRLHPVEGLDYAGACRPALGVGGDYYDFLMMPGGRLGIAIGDVSGKGIAAALLMASLQASLRGQTMQVAGQLAQVIANVNRLVFDTSPDNRYATFFYAQYDPSTRRLTYVNAGHCAPMVLRRRAGAAAIERLKTGGTVVGLFAEAAYSEGTIQLEPGDRIVAYTDGISEAFNADEEEFGEERLAATMLGCDELPAAAAIAHLMERTDAFVAGAPQSDDMTIVFLRVVG